MRESISRAIVFGGAGFGILLIVQVALARFWPGTVNAAVLVMLSLAASVAGCMIVGALPAFVGLGKRLPSRSEAAVLGALAAVPVAMGGAHLAPKIGFGNALAVVAFLAAAIAAVGGVALHRWRARG